ncbi:uncharacterized protein EAF01_008743 [Botrytis porri]|uniref:Uncharacterized protein n=1 Tax=Botrytis porri TaxID=87229 RepID=A0A4Z1KLL4_9HELO|nr:uncharacterized protein EAF01_008743 [Botrytis porri]KAF7897777.1 hypothetical protein EAF01_008743 [Botrytis porri]TGO84474.1 hypothetical protein BPOR_0501g00080 [Botrytis porri]
MQNEWFEFSDNEGASGEGSKDKSQEQEFNGFSNEISDEPIEIPRLKRYRIEKDIPNRVQDIKATGYQKLTNVIKISILCIFKSIVSLFKKDSYYNQKLHSKSTSQTAKNRGTKYRRIDAADGPACLDMMCGTLREGISILKGPEEANQISSEGGIDGLFSMSHNGMEHSNTRLVSKKLLKQDRGIRTSSNVPHVNPMLTTIFTSSTIGSCAIRAASTSRIAPANPKVSFQHWANSLLLILSVAASSTNIDGVVLDGHLRSEFPAQVQLFDSIPATALQIPVGRPAVSSNTSMKVAPRTLADDTVNEIIDAGHPRMFDISGYDFSPRTELLELPKMYLRHLELKDLAFASGFLELSDNPDFELGGLDPLIQDDINLN